MKRFNNRPLRHEVLENRQLLDASGVGAGEPVADFMLNDVNSTSPTFGTNVSPGDFEGTTAWYFIHST